MRANICDPIGFNSIEIDIYVELRSFFRSAVASSKFEKAIFNIFVGLILGPVRTALNWAMTLVSKILLYCFNIGVAKVLHSWDLTR